MIETTPTMPSHVEDAVEAIARLQVEHDRSATPLQRAVERLIARAGRPGFVGLITALVLSWIVLNCGLMLLGHVPIDEPPFFWMQGALALTALYMTILILTTQRREDELASHREQLSLQLALLSEQKSAKIISLLEELRQDHPEIRNRVDHQASAMSSPADARSVLDAIKETHTALRSEETPS